MSTLIKVIGIRHGEKMYETLLTKEKCAKAKDMENFCHVTAGNRDLNNDNFFKEGNTRRVLIVEFNSNNTRRPNLEETKAKIARLEYIQTSSAEYRSCEAAWLSVAVIQGVIAND